jgi:hypothetical protein
VLFLLFHVLFQDVVLLFLLFIVCFLSWRCYFLNVGPTFQVVMCAIFYVSGLFQVVVLLFLIFLAVFG